MTYSKIGEIGYINACSFDIKNEEEFKAIEREIFNMFEQLRKDNVSRLIIDVSKNTGGNSAVGDLLIHGFYGKPYRKYQCNWKRSDECVKLYQSWGLQDQEYEALHPGEILHYDAAVVTPKPWDNRFRGQVYILIGEETFSSAIQFATIVKDNGIAPLVGETPRNGHPAHFGESYAKILPYTKLRVNFGVKEWIRPAGKDSANVLIPDILIDLRETSKIEGVISHLPK